ncbi:MAG: CapA family protein [Caldilineaceae bacterium]
MFPNKFQHSAALLAAGAMLIGGLWIGSWTLVQSTVVQSTRPQSNLDSPATAAPQPTWPHQETTPKSTATLALPDADATDAPSPVHLMIGVEAAVPTSLHIWLQDAWTDEPPPVMIDANDARATLRINTDPANGVLLYRHFFAAATRFDTANPAITWAQIQQMWQNAAPSNDAQPTDSPFAQTAILSDTLPALTQLLGAPGANVQLAASVEELRLRSRSEISTLLLLPFDQLEPRLAVLAIDGQNPVENAHYFDPAHYPLVVDYYLHGPAHDADAQRHLAQFTKELPPIPTSNRDPARLTVITVTGVTALTRMTAHQMDQFGNDWPARIIGADLAAADITHVSNEVSFVPGCQTDIAPDNLLFCSKPEYMATLTASGVDIISLTGNHQNDFGLPAALTSLELQSAAGFRLFGGGKNMAEATAPLFMEHNGNRLAFLGGNSFGPIQAWATADAPGAAPLDLDALTASIRTIRQTEPASVIFVDVQNEERYEISPMPGQRANFNAISLAGADVVTGVQAHSPQALEFTEGRLILFGLGNLYFDQMWSEPTRQGIVAKHTIYANRHISTQLLVTIIEDYGQPRWATPAEREQILTPLFRASYWE